MIAAEQYGKKVRFRDIDKEDAIDPKVDPEYNIEIIHKDIGGLADIVIKNLRHDIVEFCNFTPALPKNRLTAGSSIREVKSIKNNPRVNPQNANAQAR